MWINKLKLAIVEKNTEAIDELLNSMPSFEDKEQTEAEEAMFLLREALVLAHTLQDETSSSMQLIQQNIKFLKANQEQTRGSLNITS